MTDTVNAKIDPDEMEGIISMMETSEQESFNRGEKSQKKWSTCVGPQKDRVSKQLPNVQALTHPPRYDTPTKRTQTLGDMCVE